MVTRFIASDRLTALAWHGVKTLTCPEQRYRRLFNANL